MTSPMSPVALGALTDLSVGTGGPVLCSEDFVSYGLVGEGPLPGDERRELCSPCQRLRIEAVPALLCVSRCRSGGPVPGRFTQSAVPSGSLAVLPYQYS